MAKRICKTFDDVVAALGGTSEVARLCDRTPPAVCAWKRKRGHFPPRLYFVMIDALERAGADAPRSLWAFQEPRRARVAA